jgi:hypothetical protein
MSSSALFEENKVQDCLKLLQKHPELTIAEAARQTRASYERVRRRLRGIPASNTRGGHNKKLDVPQEHALKDHLLFCHHVGRNAGIGDVIECSNRLLAFKGVIDKNGDLATVSHRWAERWIL